MVLCPRDTDHDPNGPLPTAGSAAVLARLALVALALVGLRSLGLLELTGPDDRVEVLGRAEADRGQLALVGREEDEADLDRLAIGKPLRERPGLARCERAGERGRLHESVGAV